MEKHSDEDNDKYFQDAMAFWEGGKIIQKKLIMLIC